jgi:hypothetical protein
MKMTKVMQRNSAVVAALSTMHATGVPFSNRWWLLVKKRVLEKPIHHEALNNH